MVFVYRGLWASVILCSAILGCNQVLSPATEGDGTPSASSPAVEQFQSQTPISPTTSESTTDEVEASTKVSTTGNPTSNETDIPLQRNQQIVFVDNAPKIKEDGRSWETAFSSVQTAIDAASNQSEASDDAIQVWVKQGHYFVGVNSADGFFHIKSNVSVIGGFQGMESTLNERIVNAESTILDGRSSLDNTLRAEHVVVMDNNTRLDGVTITGGNAEGQSFAGVGGGVIVRNATAELGNILFVANFSALGGAAIYAEQSDLVISNCEFRSNYAMLDGGAVHGVSSDINIENSVFKNNESEGYGGAIFADDSVIRISRTQLMSNNADGGGALATGDCDVELENTLLADNTAFSGGAVFSQNNVTFKSTNCTFADNYAQDLGGAVLLENGADTSSATIVNNIFAGDYPDELIVRNYANDTVPMEIEWNAIEGGYPGTNNLDVPPSFAPGKYSLSKTSPCINAALDELAPYDDINGKLRESADLGAFEF